MLNHARRTALMFETHSVVSAIAASATTDRPDAVLATRHDRVATTHATATGNLTGFRNRVLRKSLPSRRRLLKIVLLLCCSCILRQVPFNIAILVLECTPADLKGAHCHSRTDFSKLDAIVASSNKNMMADLNTILDVFERYDTVAHLVFARDGLPWGEEVLQDLDNALTQRRRKAVEDEMRI